jgi:hypothetical protein
MGYVNDAGTGTRQPKHEAVAIVQAVAPEVFDQGLQAVMTQMQADGERRMQVMAPLNKQLAYEPRKKIGPPLPSTSWASYEIAKKLHVQFPECTLVKMEEFVVKAGCSEDMASDMAMAYVADLQWEESACLATSSSTGLASASSSSANGAVVVLGNLD